MLYVLYRLIRILHGLYLAGFLIVAIAHSQFLFHFVIVHFRLVFLSFLCI